jgi:hypothetical protein
MKWSGSSSVKRRLVVCVGLCALVASCGGDAGSSSSTAPTASAPSATSLGPTTTAASAVGSTATTGSAAPSGDVCADREALRGSVDALQDVDVRAEGTDGLEAAIGDVKADLATLSASAGSELQPQVQAVRDAIEQVETAVANFDSGGAAQAVTAVSALASAASALFDSVGDDACG